MTQTIADFPAYRIYKPYDGRKFRHGEKIALPFNSRNHGVLWHFFTLGTVEGYAIENGECPHEALQRHEEMKAKFNDGRRRYWAGANCVTIHNGPHIKTDVPGFSWGDTIILQGKAFVIEHAPNDNIELIPAD